MKNYLIYVFYGSFFEVLFKKTEVEFWPELKRCIQNNQYWNFNPLQIIT